VPATCVFHCVSGYTCAKSQDGARERNRIFRREEQDLSRFSGKRKGNRARDASRFREREEGVLLTERRVIDRQIQFRADNETPLEEEHAGVTIVLIPFNTIVANCQSAKQCTPSLEGGNVKDTLL